MYKKNLKKLMLLILLSLLIFSCAKESETQKCATDEVLINNICTNKTLLCGKSLCSEHETCEESTCKKTLVFSTYNLYDLKNPYAYKNLAKFIKEKNIAIMVSQEIQVEDKEALLKELNALNIDAEIKFSTYGGYGGDDGNDYLAVISRWPIDEIDTILTERYQDPISGYSYSFNNMRPVLEIKLKVFDKAITIFNIHLKAQSPWPSCPDCIRKRRAQAYALENYIIDNLDPINDDIIIAGDANTATETGEDFEKGNTLDMLTLKTDENNENDFLSINYEYKRESTHTRYESIMDHIILSPKLLEQYIDDSVNIITPSGTPSDHKALLLKLKY